MLPQDHLKQLRNKLHNGQLSVLVGAGFSLNLSKRFSSWQGILEDLVLDLCGESIKLNFELLRSVKPDIDFNEFQKAQVKNYIADKGYLNVASEYIRKKGFPEAIATYIEQRTPLAKREGDQIYLRVYDKDKADWFDEKQPENCLGLHRSLIELPWNNIYTTNYDNLLELAINDDLQHKLSLKIESLEEEIREKRKSINERIAEENRNLAAIEEAGDNSPSSVTMASDMKPSSHRSDVHRRQIAYLEEELKDFESDRTEQINGLNNLKEQIFSIVRHSADLAIKGRRNIIKLHGDLRDEPKAPFGFDGDYSSHYVISKEDYESYPTKHEAFTQLMRISLLRETFCLIGFSGDDPNFTAWVSWVRDIIHRKKDSEKGKETKVYLISVSDSELTAERELFFHNHRIIQISLRKCLAVFGYTASDKVETRQLLESFLKYLTTGLDVSPLKIAVELIEQADYSSFWNSLPVIIDHWNKKSDFTPFKDIAFPQAVSKANRIPSIISNYRRDGFLNWAPVDLPQCPLELKPNMAKLVIRAAYDSFLPLSAPSLGSLGDTLSQPEYNAKVDPLYTLLKMRDNLWADRELKHDLVTLPKKDTSLEHITAQHQALQAMFRFDFSRLKKILLEWVPIDHWTICKAGLMAVYDTDAALKILETNTQQVAQEQLLNYLLQRFIKARDFRVPKDVQAKIDSLKNEGLKSPWDNLDYLVEKMSIAERKWSPHGTGKFSFDDTTTYSVKSRLEYAIQYFGILMEAGIPVRIDNVTLNDANKTYPMIKTIFEIYPAIALFYSIHLGNEKVLRRIGQDFAYSEMLSEHLTQISDKLKAAYVSDDTPHSIKNNILIFYSELLIALRPEEWNDFYIQVWTDLKSTNKLFSDRYTDTRPFINNGIRYITDTANLKSIITDCLEAVEKNTEEGNNSITTLYHLASNSALSHLAEILTTSDALYSKLQAVADTIKNNNIQAIFALGNLHKILDTSTVLRIGDILKASDMSQFNNERVWRVIRHFSTADNDLNGKISNSITNSKQIWNSNITEKSSSVPEFISLYRLRTAGENSPGISFSSQQVNTIFEKLKIEFDKIEKYVTKHKETFDYTEILREMYIFLNNERSSLQADSQYEHYLLSVTDLYHKQRGFTSIDEGLESTEKGEVIMALEALSIELYFEDGLESRIDSINIVMNRLILQAPPALSASLIYLVGWLYDFQDVPIVQTRFKDIGLRLLKKLSQHFGEDIDQPTLEQNMVRLAIVLNEWGTDDPIVPHYMIKAQMSRFNNVKQTLFEN